MTKIRVWLSHDGYRDPDDNLAQLVGAAKARTVALSNPDVSIAGLIFGDTTDGGQYHMVHPGRRTPWNMDGDSRFDEVAANRVAAGNYAFFQKYAAPALRQMAPGWEVIDTIKNEAESSWNFSARTLSGISYAARELVSDIKAAIAKGGSANPNEVVVYSAGGGAHVAAEAIAFLRHTGWSQAQIKEHFAIVQHGRTNFALNLEPAAQDITRVYTLPISKQDLDTYANGMHGPGLARLARDGVFLDGGRFGGKMAEALDVAQGLKGFQNLGSGKTFKKTTDGSDAGSHAFAVDEGTLMANWGRRLNPGDWLPSASGREHLIAEADGGFRLRVIYDEFDWGDARQLMNARSSAADAVATDTAQAAVAQVGQAVGEKGAGLVLGEATVFAFAADGSAAGVGVADGKIGVEGIGEGNDVERGDGASETLLVDLATEADVVALVLAGLATRDGAKEAAQVTGYDADGEIVGTLLVTANGRTQLDFDAPVVALAIEAAEWQGAGAAEHAAADFSLVWVDPL